LSNQTTDQQRHGNAYNLFILVLTVLSLGIMVALLLPLSDATIRLLQVYDTVICLVFLVDFALNLKRAPTKRGYFLDERGWLDLLGSIPSLGFFRYTALLRLARLSRFARISRLVGAKNKHELFDDVIHNRGQYAAFITLLAALMVMVVCGVAMLEAESRSSEPNITTGGDALWWSMVTITTVGYGDRYPVTMSGRVIATFVMVAGVGIIASLASILASVLIPPANPQSHNAPMATDNAVIQELASMRRELAELRQAIAAANAAPDS
jgi:voltage-gated potassium channel